MVFLGFWLLQPEAGPLVDGSNYLLLQDTTRKDTVNTDTLGPYTPTKEPTFQPSYRFGDPFSNRMSPTPLQLADPSSIDLEVDFDSSVNYSVYERIGDVNFRPVTTMSFEEYDRYNDQQITKEYFKQRSSGLDGESAVSGRSLIPRLYISPVFDRLFGGSYVDIQPNGFVNLDFGGRFQRVDNPALPVRQQRNGGFNFNQQISLNLVGKIGEKLAVTANFDNNNTFDFQNNMKVEYTGYEEDIVKKIEIGNVSMPVTNSLMTGAQSLFGVKTQLQFGKLWVTGVITRQQGKSEVLTIESGFQGREFEVRASNYDENRHFFLSHYFRDNYERWLNNLPQVNSGVNVTKVEVYVINRNNDTRTTREVLALMDLGETREVYRDNLINVSAAAGAPTANDNNDIWDRITTRNTNEVTAALEGQGFVNGTDFVKIGTARKLEDDEFVINSQLGYITLLRKLQNDEMLAVSYQYSTREGVHTVGELAQTYGTYGEDEVIVMKMLRPNKINTEVPTWDLMMKNIYNLNASQIEREGFTLRIHYRDDASGIDNPSLHEGRLTKDKPLIEIMGLDQLNQNNDSQRDGNFDYIEGITIDPRNGNIIFPVLEPFGETLREAFDDSELGLIEKYVYDTLYETTKADAELVASKDKYFILGKYNAGSSSEIALPGLNIAENSVVVTAGNTPLTEGLDYTVDYNLGRVRILNEGIMNSGKTINISYEKADLFNFQSRWLTGARMDYRFSERFNIGGTILRLNERPGGISRYSIGDEPTRNTKYGFDINYQDEVPFLTKAMDFLPLVSTKAPSSVTFNAEFAQMIPGTSNLVDGKGTSYIDDFEQAITPISLSGWTSWQLASTPKTTDDRFYPAGATGPQKNFKRAKIAWYSIDPTIYQPRGMPDGFTEDDLQGHYLRPVLPQEVFPQRQNTQIVTPLSTFDIAYYPSERGQYNYNPALSGGLLQNPESNYGGITRAITNEVDFDKNNIEYLEFWVMDPFIEGPLGRDMVIGGDAGSTDGGELVFNLGNVSEDIIPDGRHAFESGLPGDGDPSAVEVDPVWGTRVPADPFLVNFFESNNAQARANQDIGLDGLDNAMEQSAFPNLGDDPSADNFKYYLDTDYDADDNILERYKYFNGMEGNSPAGSTTRASTTIPNNEDLNQDNTISDLEEYYEYRVPLEPGQLSIDQNKYVVDRVNTQGVDWYLFRIPVRDAETAKPVGGINGFKTIRYVRMYLTGFRLPVVLRMAKLQLVGSQWRKYQEALNEPGLNEVPETSYSDFTVSVVDIEGNGNSTDDPEKVPYVIPPGINRDRDNTTIVNRQVNEQSLKLCVEDLEDKDARAVYKRTSFDLLNYGRLMMFFHAEKNDADDFLQDGEVTGFIRLGTDFTENYYEIEVPLQITPFGINESGDALREAVWPTANEIDIAIDELLTLKSRRNKEDFNNQIPYIRKSEDGKYNLSVKGRPDISSVQVMMIGVRNPESPDRSPKSVCIWANELRVTDFDTNKGWAANARMSTKLADVATVSASTRYTGIGFGNIQQTIQQREREETFQYDLSANINVEKFLLPEKTGLKVPMFVSLEKSRSTPQFDPLDPDTPLEAALLAMDSEEQTRYRRLVEDRTTRRSLNFTNVRKEKVNPEAKKFIWDIENFSFSYAYSDIVTSNVNTQSYIQKSQSGGVAYNYSPKPIIIEPFAKSKAFDSPYLKLIKDINFSPVPTSISFRGDLNRNFRMTQYYNEDLTTEDIDPLYERLFTFNRVYGLRWSIFKNLSLDYNARVNAIIDEFDKQDGGVIEGDINTDIERQYILDQIKNLGRMKNFMQDVSATYKLPFDKLPLTDWISADVRYAVSYAWTAGSLNQLDSAGNFFGHTLQNRRDRSLSGKIDMVKLYNKVTFLKDANTPSRPSGNNESSSNVGKGILRTLMSLRNINVTYNIREGTILSGYVKTPFLLGMDSSWSAPGWDFLLGGQDPDIRYKAARNGWLTKSSDLTSPFQQTYSTDLGIRAAIEPSNELKIQLEAKKTNMANYQEIFSYNSEVGQYESIGPNRSGSYSISFLAIKTSFDSKGENNSSEAFEQFAKNIETVRVRQNQLNPLSPESGHYDSLSQDVLIPAFLSAYSGTSASDVALKPFPEIPIPNWRIDYTGLSKIPLFADLFSSITISHGYRSLFNVNNYTYNSSDYGNPGANLAITLDKNILDYPQATQTTEDGRFVPVYTIDQVTITEQYMPLIGINIRTKSNLSTRIEYKKERSLSLNMSNAQVQETTNNDVTLDFGLTKENFKLPFRWQGRTITLENDLTFRMSMTIRDSETIQRRLRGEDKVSNGNTNFQLRPSATYKINDKLDLTMYFERSVTEPRISSFKTATTAFGTQLRFSLAQ